MTLPTKPAIAEALIRRCKQPYDGEINPGDVFAWEPDLPHARELLIVTRLSGPRRDMEVRHALGVAFISTGSEDLVWTIPLDGKGEECGNSIPRFREAVHPTAFKPMSTMPSSMDVVPWPFGKVKA